MIHRDLTGMKFDTSLPEGYYFRNFKDGDIGVWADIERSAGEFTNIQSALTRFNEEFEGLEPELRSRCFFLCNDRDDAIGTAMGWYGNFDGEDMGRLHWIAIKPQYQGKKLGKPLVAKAMARIQKSHNRAYLTSQTTSWKAINMYLDFGFEPLYTVEDDKKAWVLLRDKLGHPALLS